MNAFEAYNLFNSLKLHFSSQRYDFFKFNGKIKTTIHAFNKRKDRYFYEKLAKHQDPKNLILANIIDGNLPNWIGDIVKSEDIDRIYQNWLKRQESLSYIYKHDLSKLDKIFDNNFFFDD